jgi:hypothetical protein
MFLSLQRVKPPRLRIAKMKVKMKIHWKEPA